VLQVFYSVNALRQALKTHSRIHGVITHGGEAANVIPDYTAAKFLVRAKEQHYLEELEERFLKIVEAAALATGTRAEVSRGISYQPRVANSGILEALAENMAALGVTYEIPSADAGVGSSDIGNVSQLVPTIHPNLKTCETGIIGHTPEFAEAAAGPLADEALVTGATLLAWTGADVMLRPEVRDRVHATFREQLGRDPQV
jgi:metal-dependent amidase/aminoacylase/carboxypeptidase family protein